MPVIYLLVVHHVYCHVMICMLSYACILIAIKGMTKLI